MDGSGLFHDKICISGFVLNLKIKNTILEVSFFPKMVLGLYMHRVIQVLNLLVGIFLIHRCHRFGRNLMYYVVQSLSSDYILLT